MKVNYENSIEYQVIKKIEGSAEHVVLRRELSNLGSYRQISRVLQKLIVKKRLVKIGSGVYAKAYSSEFIKEPLIVGGFDTACQEALNKLNVLWELSSDVQAYNQGITQQVPTQTTVRLKSRCRREIAYATRRLYFEGNINAR